MTDIIDIINKRGTIGDTIEKILANLEFVQKLDSEPIDICIRWKNEIIGYDQYYFPSAMKNCYHPAPRFFYGDSAETLEQLNWLKNKVDFKFTIPTNYEEPESALTILSLRNSLMTLVGAESIDRFIKTSGKIDENKGKRPKNDRKNNQQKKPRETCTAKFKMIFSSPSATKENLPQWYNKYQGDYFRALSFAGEFAGRVELWYDAWLRAHSAILAKVGLLHHVVKYHKEELVNLPITTLFLTLASAEFGKRKEFTLESQKQGGLNVYLERLLELVKEKEPQGIRFIAYLLPGKEIWDLTPVEELESIHKIWTEWMGLFAIVLEEQWEKGVKKSARRNMRVLPGSHWQNCGKCDGCKIKSNSPTNTHYYSRYHHYCSNTKEVGKSGVNSSLWNAVADAWQNGSRVLRGLDLVLHKPAKFWGKTLQLIANDQFAMADHSGKSMDPNVNIFDKITRDGILPWRVAHPKFKDTFDSVQALTTVLKYCSEAKIIKDGIEKPFGLNSWIGIPQIRKAEVTIHNDLICGCVVPPMTPLVYDWVNQVIKPFGATGWSGN